MRFRAKVVILSMLVIGLILACLGIIRFWDWHEVTHRTDLPSPSQVVTHSEDTPSETTIDTGTVSYNVAPDQPKMLTLPSLGVSGFIQKVGIDQHKAIATPNNVHMAGWYTHSVKPGEDGVSVIDGHVRGRYAPAIFSRLDGLQPGNDVSVMYGDGRRVDFKVVKVAQYNKDKALDRLFEKLPSIDQQLVLITCSGTFNASTATYDQRTLVYAERVGSL